MGLPALLLAALAALMATVAAVWALAATSAVWAMVCAMIVAMSGMMALLTVINRQLADSDGAGAKPQHSDGGG